METSSLPLQSSKYGFECEKRSKLLPKHTWRAWVWRSLYVFGDQVLVFPLLVVVLACTAFLFGGRCAAWQWWTAVAAVVVLPFLKKCRWREALVAVCLWGVILLLLEAFIPPMLWDDVSRGDMPIYHLPMAQLLIEGWNPVMDPLCKDITAQLGLDLWGMAPTLVAFYSKTMAVFSAVSYEFVKDPTGLTIPGLVFLWLGVLLQTMLQFQGVTRWIVLVAQVLVLPMVDGKMYVDLSLAFASCGLLFSMADALTHGRYNWMRLFIWTIWMMTIKLNGLLAAMIFWGLFIGVTLWKNQKHVLHWLKRFALFGTMLIAFGTLILWSPHVTAWQMYGHPLYPFASGDDERFPASDPTWEHRLVNDDYKFLGRIGLWVYHFVSPGLAKMGGRFLSGHANFNPQSKWFSGQYVHNTVRPWLWVLFIVLLFHPRGRIWAFGGLLSTWLVPWEKIGFLRYVPWLSALGCLAIGFMADSLSPLWQLKWKRHAVQLILLVILLPVVASWIERRARGIELKHTELSLVRPKIHVCFWGVNRSPLDGVNPDDFVARYNYLTALENYCRLLSRGLWKSQKDQPKVLGAFGWVPDKKYPWQIRRPLWKWDERQWFVPEGERDERFPENLGEPWQGWDPWDGLSDPESDVEAWVMTPWRYWVPLDAQAEHVVQYFTMTQRQQDESRIAWGKRLVRFTAKTWFVRYPREVWKWLTKT